MPTMDTPDTLPESRSYSLYCEDALNEELAAHHNSEWNGELAGSNCIKLFVDQCLKIEKSRIPDDTNIPECDTLAVSLKLVTRLTDLEYDESVLARQQKAVGRTNYFLRNIHSLATSGSIGEAARLLFFQRASRRLNDRFFEYANSQPALIHVGADFSGHSIPLPNLHTQYRKFASGRARSNQVRQKIKKGLKERGVDATTAQFISFSFPTCFIENYSELVKIADRLNPKVVFTNIYTLAADPLLAIASAKSHAMLVYVQHGGSYCLWNSPLHSIERAGCRAMMYWGLGDRNVFPTNLFPSDYVCSERHSTRDILILFSHSEEVVDITRLVRATEHALPDRRVTACLHPRARRSVREGVSKAGLKYVVGVSDEQVRTAALVIFDSALHTLLYLRIGCGLPFIVVKDEYTEPQFERAGLFLETLEKEGIFVSSDELVDAIDNIRGSHDVAEKFRDSGAIWRRLIFANPTLREVVREENLLRSMLNK